MKQYLNILSDFSFYLLLGFLFLINFSIAGCYLIFVFLIFELLIHFFKNKKIPELPKFYKYFLLYILFTLISTIFSIDKLNSLKDNKEIFTFLLIPILILVINSRKRLNYSLFIVLISTLISSITGIFYVLKYGISLDHRIKGFTSHWMTYSGLLMFIFIFFFIYSFYEKRKRLKTFIIIILIIIITAILCSQTRSVWMGIIVALVIFIIYYKFKILYFAIPTLLILILLLPSSIKTRITSIVDLNNETNRDRIYMIETGFKIFKKYPLTGVGANNINKKIYRQYMSNQYKNDMPQKVKKPNTHLHNNFLQILAERGIFVLISLILAFISIFINLIHKIKKSINFEKIVSICVLFVFLGFFIAGMFEYNFGDTEIKFILFYFLSIPFIRFKADKLQNKLNKNK